MKTSRVPANHSPPRKLLSMEIKLSGKTVHKIILILMVILVLNNLSISEVMVWNNIYAVSGSTSVKMLREWVIPSLAAKTINVLLDAIWVAYYKTACYSLKTGVAYKDSRLIQLSFYKRKKGDGKKKRGWEKELWGKGKRIKARENMWSYHLLWNPT